MAKMKNDYFKLMEQQVSYCVQASDLLGEILSKYSAAEIPQQREKMHAIEHQADALRHDILSRLSTEFITPMDQEDLLEMVQIFDDITDALDEAVEDFYMFHIVEAPEDAAVLAQVVNRCVNALLQAAQELKNFKKPEHHRQLLKVVNKVETEADNIYVEAIHKLFAKEESCKKLIGYKAVYDRLENCCDLCEHAVEVMEQIITKNT